MLAFLGFGLEVAGDHHLDQRGEVDLGTPAEALAGLGGVADQQVDLGRPEELGVLAHVALPVVDADLGERPLDELTHRVRLAGGDDVVVGLVLLQHQPHRPHVVAGVPPVTLRVQRPHHQLVLQPELDPRRRVGHLAGHELDAPARPLVVEQDPRAGEQPVALPIVDGDVVAEHLGAAVRRARMERRHLVLRRLAHLAEHLRRRRLIEADRVVLRAARPCGSPRASATRPTPTCSPSARPARSSTPRTRSPPGCTPRRAGTTPSAATNDGRSARSPGTNSTNGISSMTWTAFGLFCPLTIPYTS